MSRSVVETPCNLQDNLCPPLFNLKQKGLVSPLSTPTVVLPCFDSLLGLLLIEGRVAVSGDSRGLRTCGRETVGKRGTTDVATVWDVRVTEAWPVFF